MINIHALQNYILKGCILLFAAFMLCSGGLSAGAATTQGSVIFENRFTVAPEQLPQFLESWDAIGAYMKEQPGFLSAELHRNVLGKDWQMSEEWDSLSAYRQAVSSSEFQDLVKDFPAKANWFAQDLFPVQP